VGDSGGFEVVWFALRGTSLGPAEIARLALTSRFTGAATSPANVDRGSSYFFGQALGGWFIEKRFPSGSLKVAAVPHGWSTGA
jgi:hypothetical protein